MKYLILSEFLSGRTCDQIRRAFEAEDKPVSIELADGEIGNKTYTSKRSNLSYKYLTDLHTEDIKKKLSLEVGKDFNNSINSQCLPVVKYGEGGFMKAHRDIKKASDLESYQEWVGVAMLSDPSEYSGGVFYLNDYALVSKDGKEVVDDFEMDRQYFNLKKGDILLFHNPSFVHGVSEVTKGVRYTCGFRSNDIGDLKLRPVYTLRDPLYNKEFKSVSELVSGVLEDGADPNYHILKDGISIGNTAWELMEEEA